MKGSKYVAGRVTERLRDHSWFIAYAPAENPTIALAVLVENGGFGAQSAAPIARQVIDYHLLGNRGSEPAREDADARDGDPDDGHAGHDGSAEHGQDAGPDMDLLRTEAER